MGIFSSTLGKRINRRGEPLKPMNQEELEKIVKLEIEEASNFIDSDIASLRILADGYYQGKTVLQHEKGRSGIVITKVRDTVKSVIPSVARIFTQSDVIAEFSSDDEEDDKICKDQTLFVNSVYHKFGGYSALIQGSTDALKARVGIVKVTLEKKRIGTPSKSMMMTEEEIASMEMQEEMSDDMEITEKSPPVMQMDGTPARNIVMTRYSTKNIWHLDPIPPENFIVNAGATSAENARLIGTREEKRIYEAVEMGLDVDELLEIGGTVDGTSEKDAERQARQAKITTDAHDSVSAKQDPTSRFILICEVWMRIDADGDGIAELRHIITAGANCEILVDEPCHHVPLGLFKSDLQPHVFFPISLAEDMMQDQDAATSLTRSILDNTALVNSPRTEINESRVNLDDAKNNEIGAIIRVKEMGQINELATPFVAGQTLPVLSYLNEVSEARSGVTRLSQGLDPNALQSTSRIAANAAVQGGDSRIEMMARNLGETGIASMFLAILRTAMYELKGEQSVKSSSGYDTINPDHWHDQINVIVNVGLGNGRIDEKVQVLTATAGAQQVIIDKMGYDNPICSWQNLRTTYKLLLRLGGLKTVSDFFPPVTKEILMDLDKKMGEAAAAANQAPPAPDLVGAEKIKGQVAMQINQAKLQQEGSLKTASERQKGLIEVGKLKVKQQGDVQRLTVEARTKMQLALLEDDRLRDAQDQDYAVAAEKVAMDAETKAEVAQITAETRTMATEK